MFQLMYPSPFPPLTTAILEYSLATQQTSLVAHFSQKADSWIEAWGLTVDASRVLLRSFALVLEKESDKSVAVKALVRYFQTYKNESGSYPAEVEKLITTAVLSAINSPLDAFGDRIALLEVSSLSVLWFAVVEFSKWNVLRHVLSMTVSYIVSFNC